MKPAVLAMRLVPLAAFLPAFLPAFVLLAALPAQAADLNAVNHAAQIASGVGAGSAVPALGVGALVQTIVGLAVVIGLVFGCAWLARRLGLQPGQRGGLVKTVGGTSLGGKERVTVVEIGDQWLVLGAAPGNVRLLYAMPAGSTGAAGAGRPNPGAAHDDFAAASADGHHAASSAGSGLPGTFGQRFRDALKNEAAKRLQRHSGGDR
jgi:flagellar protein FliO/FliZ